ncbi:MAG: nitroreductase family protein [Rikenellaceae bacterium]
MSFLDSISWRYATKVYDPRRYIAPAVIDQLKEILRLSPSSINSQPWHFSFVSDPSLKDQFARASYFNEQKISQCQCLVVFSRVDNVEYFESELLTHLSQGAKDYYESFVKPLPHPQIRTWFANQLYLSLGVLLSGCAVMGIDSTPMEGIDADRYDSLLGLENFRSVVAVALGYRDSRDHNQLIYLPKERFSASAVVSTL